MATIKHNLKPGMGGSNSGKSRSEPTEVLKTESKKQRRLEGKAVIKNETE